MSDTSLSDVFKRLPRWVRRMVTPFSGLFLYHHSGLRENGWFESLTQLMPVDERGDPVPWMNYPVIRLLDDRLTSDLVLFEYGSGNSTKWFADRTHSVTSIEHDSEWAEIVEPELPENAELVLKTNEEAYVDALPEFADREGSPDVVIVDGKYRVECIREAIEAGGESTVIVLDDCSRDEYAAGIRELEQAGFNKLVIGGMKPMAFEASDTAIFYRDSNCFGI